jgi:hypothetical protein
MKIINLALAALFLLFAAAQLNDPDPLGWTVLYAFVSGVCAFAAFGKSNKHVLWVGIGVCVVWMILLLPEFIRWINMGMPGIVGQMKAEAPHIEFTREFLGLGICAAALAWQLRRGRKSAKNL